MSIPEANMMLPDSIAESLFSVRCIFRFDDLYEERITMWRATSAEHAIAQSDQEARQYAYSVGGTYLGLAQAYRLADDPREQGAEVFSLLRTSALEPEKYLEHFFDTGQERQRQVSDNDSL